MANKSKHMIHSLGHSMSFGMLSLRAKVLWPMLIAEADDQGRFDARPKVVKWSVCQNVDEIGTEDIAGLLGEMVNEGMLLLYGADFGQVLNWWPHQPMNYARPSKYPAPHGWHDRIRYHNGKEIVMDGWGLPGGFPEGTEDDTPIVPPNDTPKDGGQLNLTKPNLTKLKKGALPRDPHLDHQAIIGYKELVHLHVPTALREDWVVCAEEVGTERLLAFTKEWIGNGWNKQNVNGIMEYARKGGGEGKHGKSSRPDLSPERIAQRAEFDRAAEADSRRQAIEYGIDDA